MARGRVEEQLARGVQAAREAARHADEAAVELDLLDHPFYVFKNKGTGQINVVYKRNSGGVGSRACPPTVRTLQRLAFMRTLSFRPTVQLLPSPAVITREIPALL